MRGFAVVSVAFVLAVAFSLSGCKREPGSESTVSGQGGAKLTINQPDAVTLMRGGAAKVHVVIERRNVDGPVAIAFQNLPTGVTVVPGDMKIVGTEGDYTLQAAADAQLVAGDRVLLTASAPSVTSTIVTSATVELVVTVKEKQ